MNAEDHTARWDHGEFHVAATGAMCAPAIFRLGNGRLIQPFAVAPWADEGDERSADLPPLLRRLRGDWACVPFGMPQPRHDLPPGWLPPGAAPPGDGFFHGPSSNLAFALTGSGDGLLEFTLDYPPDHPISRVRRSIRGLPGRPVLAFDLEVRARRPVSLPVGVHPVLRLPAKPRAAKLSIAGEAAVVYTYPVEAEPGVSRLALAGRFPGLDRVLDRSGRIVDLSRHPLADTTEEIVLVSPVNGRASLVNTEEGYRVDLTWDPCAFPSCVLWISNGGRAQFPWSGRHRALGIEPVAAPFDLGEAVATNPDNPLAQAGVRTAQDFTPGQVWATRYTIEVSPA